MKLIAGVSGKNRIEDGLSSWASFLNINDLVVDQRDGSILILDLNSLRMLSPAGAYNLIIFLHANCTVAGMVYTISSNLHGYIDGHLSATRFSTLFGITMDSHGSIYVTEVGVYDFCTKVRKITSAGMKF